MHDLQRLLPGQEDLSTNQSGSDRFIGARITFRTLGDVKLGNVQDRYVLINQIPKRAGSRAGLFCFELDR